LTKLHKETGRSDIKPKPKPKPKPNITYNKQTNKKNA
jgi:hypothetical protein